MPLPVQLKDVVNEMEFGGNEWTAYVNRKTGEVTSFPNDLLSYEGEVGTAVGEWDEEMVADCKRILDDKDFVELPGEHEIHEYAIMERFCLSVENEQHRERLLDAISGKGAFRRFKDVLMSYAADQASRTQCAVFLRLHTIGTVWPRGHPPYGGSKHGP